MKKIMSVLLSVSVIVCCLLPSFSASAATNCFSISIKGTLRNSIIEDELTRINTQRADNGMSELELDSSLEEFAQQRATEAVLGGDINHSDGKYEEHCSDGTSLSFIYPDYGKSIFTVSVSGYSDFKDALDALYSFEYENIKSIGIAAYVYNKTESYYAICSKSASASPYTDFEDKTFTKAVNVHYKYFDTFSFTGTLVGNKYYKLSVKGLVTGFLNDYISIPNSQVTFKSTNPSVYKTKDNNGYVKGTGKFDLKLCDKKGVAVTQFENLSAKINLSAPNTEILSNKKRRLTVRWQKFTDCTGYQIQYSLKKNMKKSKTITVKGADKSKRVIKKLKSKNIRPFGRCFNLFSNHQSYCR